MPPDSTRNDVLLWVGAVGAAAVATLIASVAGARLGPALTAGVIVLVAAVVGATIVQDRSR